MKSLILRSLAAFWILVFAASLAQAYNPADLNKLLTTNQCAGGDLSGADLTEADLSRADLSGADLTGADLTGAYLTGADLRGADLRGADLRWADLYLADLSGADLIGASLGGADLSRAYLRGADLSGANLIGADLYKVDLSWAFYYSDMPPQGIDLSSLRKVVRYTPTPTPTATITPTPTITPTATATPIPYHLRASLPLSGLVENYGRQVQKGLELALEDHLQAGGIWLDLQIEDNKSTLAGAGELIRTAVEDPDILAFIGGVISSHALEEGLVASERGFPFFSPTATTQQLDSDLYRSYVIKVAPSDNYQIEAIKYFLTSFGAERIVLIHEDSAYGNGFKEGLTSDPSIQVVDRYAFPYGALGDDTRLAAAVKTIENAVRSGARLGVLAVYDQDANRLLKRLAEIPALKNFGWILTDGATIDTTLKGLPPESLFYQPWLFGLTPSIAPDLYTSQEFKSRFEAQFSQKPEWFSYYGYDSFMACATALEAAGEKSREGIWDAVANLSFEGVTGRKWFDEKGMLQSAIYDIKKAVDGEFVILGEVRVKQPDISPNGSPSGKSTSPKFTVSQSDLVFRNFTYTFPGGDEKIGHVAGGPGDNNSWMARSRDYGDGWVLVAFYEDAARGLTEEGQEFGFRDGVTYHLNFDLSRETLANKIPGGPNILQVKVTSVCRYRDQEGIQHFASRDLVQASATFADWPEEGPFLLEIPVQYASAAPEGIIPNDEDHRLNWEIRLLNSANQELTLRSVSIVQGDTTGIEDFMLH